MDAVQVIQLVASVLVPFILFIVSTAYSESRKDRAIVIEKLNELQGSYNDLNTRLSILESNFADIDPHPSRHRRPSGGV